MTEEKSSKFVTHPAEKKRKSCFSDIFSTLARSSEEDGVGMLIYGKDLLYFSAGCPNNPVHSLDPGWKNQIREGYVHEGSLDVVDHFNNLFCIEKMQDKKKGQIQAAFVVHDLGSRGFVYSRTKNRDK